MSHKPRRFIRRSGALEESQLSSSLESYSTETSTSSSSSINIDKESSQVNDHQINPPPPIDEPTSPTNHHDNDSGGSVQVVTSPKKKRRFFKNVQSQDSPSLMNTSFTSDSVENATQLMMDVTSDNVDSPNIKDPMHEAPPIPAICETAVEEEKKEEQKELIEEQEEKPIDPIINEEVVRTEEINEENTGETEINEEEVKKPAKRSRKPRKKGVTVLHIDSTNCVMIGGRKFPVKKLSKRLIINLTDIIPELEDMDDLPVEITNLMEDFPEFFNEDRNKIKQTCFLTCSINALNTKKEEFIIDILFTQTIREYGFVTFYCHFCRTKQGCRMICDISKISNKREFYEKHNISKPDPNFQFTQRLPCMVTTCKDCFEKKELGDFDHYLYNGGWVCTHCRYSCDSPLCTKKSGISLSECKYDGKNALEQFIMMASDKADIKKQLSKVKAKKEEVITTKQEPARKRGRPSVKKETKVESSESEEEVELSSESSGSEEEVKITKRVTRSSKSTPSSSKSQSSSSSTKPSSNKKVKQENKTSISHKTPEKEAKQDNLSSKEEEEIIASPPKQPSISPIVKREMADSNAKELAKYFIGAACVARTTSNVNSSI
ncbi:predicted protein [Naegleria gruberi]|uniref:Predicted protein n=1 Tax=Naegleria gruberi TaxID=5762 RepID=D2VXS4_NAEGR|nr:uncharacterized protein NAEGRDRAFT_59532 [Naegleria gruberi]EFC38388.1 predicted protein [Naegleria gruberi]|eukprot:XP_002671132.1 predicted protein [Naegleria gruberi strain NEG-M]